MAGKKSTPTAGRFLARLVIALAVILAGLALLAITLFHTFPLASVGEGVKARFRAQGVLVSWQSMERTFPVGLSMEKVEAVDMSTGRIVARLDSAQTGVNLLSLFKGYLGFPIAARLGNGTVTGEARIRIKGADVELEAAGLEPGAVPAVASSGLSVDGSIKGRLSLHVPWRGCPTGFARLRSGRIPANGVKYNGIPVPLGQIDTAGLDARTLGCRIVVDGAWLDGVELSARLAGEVALAAPLEASPLKATIDLMPKGDLTEKQWMLSFIRPWRKSDNYYSMTIGGTVGRPVIGR